MSNSQASAQASLPTGTTLGDRYQVDSEVRTTSFGTLFLATDSTTNARVSIHLLRDELCAAREHVEALNQAVAKASQVEHKHVARVLGVGMEGPRAFVVYEEIEGHPLSELLARKRAEGAGFSAKQVSNIAASLTSAAEACSKIGGHGAITLESIVVNKQGAVTLSGLGLGILAPLVGAALGARLSPEVRSGGAPTSQSDVYGVGAVVYELLVGVPPEKGCKRPSDAIAELTSLVDQFVGATTNPDASKRPTIGQLGPAVQKALSTPSMAQPQQNPQAVSKPARPSLAQSISTPRMDATPLPPGTHSPALIQALAETHDRWLVTKGKLDYGPFPLATIVEQIQSNQILPGNVLVDNETGNRSKVEDNPLLSDLVDAAKQKRDDERRANAEVAHAKQERSRGAMVYVVDPGGRPRCWRRGYVTIKALSSDDSESSSKSWLWTKAPSKPKSAFPRKPRRPRSANPSVPKARAAAWAELPAGGTTRSTLIWPVVTWALSG